jgi:uncharacterized NAD(P)/FAD-binding protein YdhS
LPRRSARPARRAHIRESPVRRDPVFHIAIVGFGPRGFACLERLAVEFARHGPPSPACSVTVHDPEEHPGAGPAYAPGQPSNMLLNFSAGNVDLWSDDNELVGLGQRPDFVAWLRAHAPAWASDDAFVPRRLLGSYLRDSCASLLDVLPPRMTFRHVRGEVVDIQSSPAGWSIRHADPSLDLERVDQVMVATGHGTWSEMQGFEVWSQGLPAAHRTRRIPCVYPVTERLSREAVADGAVVGVRGFALTWIDATLALTEARGGSFEGDDGTIPRYRGPDGAEPSIVPFSRSGLPLLAKPEGDLVRRSSELAGLWESLRQGILEADALTPDGLVRRLTLAGTQALAALGGQAATTPPRADPLQAMERSVQVAFGDRPPDDLWARGEAWRQAYPAVVERAGGGGVAAAFPAGFARLARAMERLAFGPPASNLARMVALARGGRLDLRVVRAPRVRAQEGRLVLEAAGVPVPIDVLVNAVIPPPGVHRDTPLLMRLVARGHARRATGLNGLMVTPDAASIGDDGRVTPGLSVVGRATEGWVVGNDTLSRTLHDHTRRWARRMVATAGRSAREDSHTALRGRSG